MNAHCTGVGGRGCPCPSHAKARVYSREWAASRRRRKMNERRMSSRTCPRKFGRWGVCGCVLESDVIGGQLVVTCRACERMAKGICRDCPRPVDGRNSRRCAACRVAANTASMRKYAGLNRDELNERARKSYEDEAVRTRRNEYKRAWRKLNREKVKAQKRREYLTPNAKRLAYHIAYREAHRVKLRNAAKRVYHEGRPQRTCMTPRCPIVLTGKKKKCTKCKERDAQRAARFIAERAA